MILNAYHFKDNRDPIFLVYLKKFDFEMGDYLSRSDYSEFKKQAVEKFCKKNRIPFPLGKSSAKRMKYIGIKTGAELFEKVAEELEQEYFKQTSLF